MKVGRSGANAQKYLIDPMCFSDILAPPCNIVKKTGREMRLEMGYGKQLAAKYGGTLVYTATGNGGCGRCEPKVKWLGVSD